MPLAAFPVFGCFLYLFTRLHPGTRHIEAGVNIYEFTPGFLHAKAFVCDDERAVVGSINLDFRSLYLHFECAAYLFRCPAVAEIEADVQATLAQPQAISLEECRLFPWYKQLLGYILRFFAPFM